MGGGGNLARHDEKGNGLDGKSGAADGTGGASDSPDVDDDADVDAKHLNESEPGRTQAVRQDAGRVADVENAIAAGQLQGAAEDTSERLGSSGGSSVPQFVGGRSVDAHGAGRRCGGSVSWASVK